MPMLIAQITLFGACPVTDTPGSNEKPTREELIALCERALKQSTVDKWHNSDSASACMQLGVGYALLCAGAEFYVLTPSTVKRSSESRLMSDDATYWVHFDFPGFDAFEYGPDDPTTWQDETAYIPTAARLDRGGDWY